MAPTPAAASPTPRTGGSPTATGAGLTSYLLEAGEWVCEVDRPDKPARKRGAKSDQIDAVRAARQALQEEHLAQPRRRGQREAIRVLKLGRQQAVDVRSRAVVQLPRPRRSGGEH